MLRTVDSWQLWGVPESIAVLKSRVIGQRDAVLLSFRDARVATITWNTHAHTIHTSALHSFEKGDAHAHASEQGRRISPARAESPP